MMHEQNDLGGGHSPIELDVQSGTFVPDGGAVTTASPESEQTGAALETTKRRSRAAGLSLLVFATLIAFVTWRFVSESRASA